LLHSKQLDMTEEGHPQSPCEVNYRQFSLDTKRKLCFMLRTV